MFVLLADGIASPHIHYSPAFFVLFLLVIKPGSRNDGSVFSMFIRQAAIQKFSQQHVIARPVEREGYKQKHSSTAETGRSNLSMVRLSCFVLQAAIVLCGCHTSLRDRRSTKAINKKTASQRRPGEAISLIFDYLP